MEGRRLARRATFLDNVTARSESGNRDFTRTGAPVRSPAGALFAMQVMPSTARKPGFGLKPADPSDPADMNRLGRQYRAKMQERYGGDLAKMWAAYNWGPGALDDAIARRGANWWQEAPPETRDYIQRNFAMLRGR